MHIGLHQVQVHSLRDGELEQSGSKRSIRVTYASGHTRQNILCQYRRTHAWMTVWLCTCMHVGCAISRCRSVGAVLIIMDLCVLLVSCLLW
jgi:hypothetical protein